MGHLLILKHFLVSAKKKNKPKRLSSLSRPDAEKPLSGAFILKGSLYRPSLLRLQSRRHAAPRVLTSADDRRSLLFTAASVHRCVADGNAEVLLVNRRSDASLSLLGSSLERRVSVASGEMNLFSVNSLDLLFGFRLF